MDGLGAIGVAAHAVAQELEGQRNDRPYTRRTHRLDGRRHLAGAAGPAGAARHRGVRGPGRSGRGFSVLNSIATAHSSTAHMRHLTCRATGGFTCQFGARISSTSALVTSETAMSSMRGDERVARQPAPRLRCEHGGAGRDRAGRPRCGRGGGAGFGGCAIALCRESRAEGVLGERFYAPRGGVVDGALFVASASGGATVTC